MPTSAHLRFAEAEGGSERGITIGREAARRFTTMHEWKLSASLSAEARLTPKPPCRPSVDLSRLDDRGVVRVGTVVKAGSILVGIVAGRPALESLSPKQRLLDAMNGAIDKPRDASLYCAAYASGVVREVSVSDDGVVVTIIDERILRVGDSLRLADGMEDVVTRIEAGLGVAEIQWPGQRGEQEVEKGACAVDVCNARSIGPYSTVTQQPLAGKVSFGGQPVRAAELAALLQHGAPFVAHEMMTVKSDDVQGRLKAYELIVAGTPTTAPTMPFANVALEQDLRALAFECDLGSQRPSIGLATDEQIRERSSGVVTSPEMRDLETGEPFSGGLFCRDIFHADDWSEEILRVGHIELPVPVMHPWAFDTVTRLLEVSADVLFKVLYEAEPLAGTATAGHTIPAWQKTGAWAIREAIGDRGEMLFFETWPVISTALRKMLRGKEGWICNDLNLLYSRVIELSNQVRVALAAERLAPSLPLEIARLQQAIDDLAEHGLRGTPATFVEGRSVEARESFSERLGGRLGRFQKALNGKTVDYSAIARVVCQPDLLLRLVRVPRRVALELWRPWIFNLLEERGFVSTIKAAKMMLEAMDPRAVTALEDIVAKHPVLMFPALAREDGSTRVASFDVQLWDEEAFGLAPAAMDLLGLRGASPAVLHVPIDRRAIDETRGSLRRPLVAVPGPSQKGKGWIARACAADHIGSVLFDAAWRGEVDPLEDLEAITVLSRQDLLVRDRRG